ncbi:BON domain-containing protein [Paractinoplanes atraurantiacus]|uniref:BON domain-containing protein n=1 Tax=Paractinoplanes atraurantiacus TaxID=1036182 RepID=A0A285GRD0_9ACTN|nr:BON domain-containing protein [Actinoplanes atraurantiacus]
MWQWRVQNVMTTDVVTASVDAPVAELVTLLRKRRIGAVPIVDDFGVVLGMVTWSDLHEIIDIVEPESPRRWWQRAFSPRLVWPEGTAAGVMNGPPMTIGADASLTAAARLMHKHGVGRLLVVGADRGLRGIVSRSDLFKVHDRLDAVIRDDVVNHVLLDELRIRPGSVHVRVEDGEVTLTGDTAHRTTALAAARTAALIPGVTDVDNQLGSEADDTASRSCRREVTPSFPKTLRKCHSTVRGLRNNRAATSGLVKPSATSRAICRS